jgi:iron complex transport system ATP-binding protein
MSGVAVETRSVSVSLGGTPILRDIDLSVSFGEVVALVGPNGAGKSTLLAVLAGDVGGTGATLLGGRPLPERSLADAARLRAVQTQQSRVSFAFTVAEVVRMGRAPWQGTAQSDRDDDVVGAALRRTDTAAFADRRILSLSGGEAARVSFARALAQEAGVLLLDEPTAALDIRHQELVLHEVRARAAAGAAVVVVLHDLSLAGAYADRIVLLADGRVRAAGTPAEVLRADVLTEVYRHPVRVVPDPVTGAPVVLPVRDAVAPAGATLGTIAGVAS